MGVRVVEWAAQENSWLTRSGSLSPLLARSHVYGQAVYSPEVTGQPALSLASKRYASQMVSVGQYGLGGVHR